MQNLDTNLPTELPEEIAEVFVEDIHVRVERIVSPGHASPKGHWYDQNQHEWVVVLQGPTKPLFEGAEHAVELGPGDWINIPSHRRHRVEWTSPDEPTVWLAVLYGSD